jgi:hypothetical protein
MIGFISSRWLYDFLTVFFKGGVFQNSPKKKNPVRLRKQAHLKEIILENS